MDAQRIQRLILDGIVELIHLGEYAQAVRQWRDVMQSWRRCPKTCEALSRNPTNPACGRCLGEKLEQESGQAVETSHRDYDHAVERLNAWVTRHDNTVVRA